LKLEGKAAPAKQLGDRFFADTVVLPICLIAAIVIAAALLLILHLKGIDL